MASTGLRASLICHDEVTLRATRYLLAIVVALAACKDKKPAVQPRPELLETVTVLAERVCACETDKDCLKEIRAEWDEEKVDLMNHGLTGDEKAQFDAEIGKLRACGDAGGLTFWMPPPPQ